MMSRLSRKDEFQKSLRSFAESEVQSDSGSESGLDIIQSSRKGLNLSQYIEALTQTPSQSQDLGDEFTEDEHSVQPSRPTRSENQRDVEPRVENDAESQDGKSELESEWSDEDLTTDYQKWKNRKTVKRKRAAAETSRLRAQKKSRVLAATSIVGRKPLAKSKKQDGTADADEFDEGTVTGETYLDEPIPDYITSRQSKLRRLHESGLRYPPNFKDIDFPGLGREEKPVMDKAVKTQGEKKSIKLHESGGVIPAPIAQWLREYQVAGVEFLHERFVKQTGAILGDDMGLGKTIQVIAFLTTAFGKTGTDRDAKYMRQIRRYSDRWYPKVLIICPGTLMRNWEDELEKWGWWEVYKYHGNPADRKGVLNAARKGMLEIMITTYATYRNNEGEINTVDWDCVIADECHQIKSKNAEITKAMNKINALCRIGLTGTAIQNKYEELWNLINWARPGAYGSAQEWRQKISLPLKLGQAHDASYQQLADARSKAKELVNDILPSVFLRRMKTLIADQLPKKSDRVVFCQLTPTQADAYQTFIESDRCEFIRTARQPCECGSGKKRGWCCHIKVPGEDENWAKFMFPCMMTLQKLANHVALLLPHSTDNNEKQAKDLDNLQTAFPDQWKEYYRIKDSVLQLSKPRRDFCGKWKVLKRLLDYWHSNGDKVLIFSHSVRLLRLLKGLFDIDGTKYNFSYLDGSMTYEDRAKVVADFNADPMQFVFLISTKAGGVGLNITSANKVVVVDPNWNPAYDLQAQDRAYRIGQTRDVEVFRLISSGTIEEIVYARQIYKQQQANIGYTASDERRYFKGVMDESTKKGELFGLENLFTFQENGLLLRDIMHKTNVAETRVGVSAMDFQFEESQADSDSDDEILSNKSLGITDDDSTLNSQMKKLADSFASDSTNLSTRGRKKYAKRAGPDPINAILAKAGVQYTHENSEVVGRSEVEARLSKQAIELRNDLDLGRKRVFEASQSQSQSQHDSRPLHPNLYDNDEEAASEQDQAELSSDQDGDVHIIGTNARTPHSREFKINYRYRPGEGIRRRQFCSMAESMGFEDPVEFAFFVEGVTQQQRRKMLDKFYRKRRRDILGEFGVGSAER